MKYMGSKSRHAKELLKIILANRRSDQYYVEPFAGGFNIIDKVTGPRIANDINKYIVELFKAIQDGWEPPTDVTEDWYNEIKNNPERYRPHLVGFVGIGCSYGGKWWGGYARGANSKGVERNYCAESRANILKQRDGLIGVDIRHGSYRDLEIPDQSVIYCDPPYRQATGYKIRFNHEEFWEWCQAQAKAGHQVFVSEYEAPDDFECVWSKVVNNTLVKNTGAKQGVERLFIYKGVIR